MVYYILGFLILMNILGTAVILIAGKREDKEREAARRTSELFNEED